MAKEKTKEICGIVMPISAIDGCDEAHWSDVQQIIRDAVESLEMEARLVSDADDIGVIQRRIVQNLYDDPIVVCDVSCKNPNVMFELGMRLAFDKPTIIVKDDKTSYSFDTSPIEHLEYPRDLRFATIIDFKKKLAAKISSTLERSKSDPKHTSFLGHFGTFKVATLDETEGSVNELLIYEFKELRAFVSASMKSMQREVRPSDPDGLFDKISRSEFTKLIHSAAVELGVRNGPDLLERQDDVEKRLRENIDAPSLFSSKRKFEAAFRVSLDHEAYIPF